MRPKILTIILGMLSLTAPASASAQERAGTWAVGVAPSYAFVLLDNTAEPDGGGSGLFVQYAVTDAMEVRLWGLWSGHAIEAKDKDPGGLYQVFNAALVFSYAFDLMWVRPAVEAGLGVLHQRYQEQHVSSMSLLLGVAADYQVLPWLEVGAAFHYHAFLQNPNQYPVYFDVGPRVIFRIR